MEYIRNLDVIITNIKRLKTIISAKKSKFYIAGFKIVRYICDANGRHLDYAKVTKILEWLFYKNATETRAFIGICIYYQIWVKDFILVVLLIYSLFKTRKEFDWGKK